LNFRKYQPTLVLLACIFARYQFFNPVQLFLRHVFSYEAAFLHFYINQP